MVLRAGWPPSMQYIGGAQRRVTPPLMPRSRCIDTPSATAPLRAMSRIMPVQHARLPTTALAPARQSAAATTAGPATSMIVTAT